MAKRIIALLAIASAAACGLDFDRYDPHAAASDGGGSNGDAALDATSGFDAADSGFDVPVAEEGGSSDGPDAGDVGAADSPTCGASGEPCCTGHVCQQGLTCRGSTCHP